MKVISFYIMERTSLMYYLSSKALLLSYIGGFLAVIFFSSCTSTKSSTAYFRTLSRDTTLSGFIDPGFQPRIQKKDVLSINISSLNREEDAFFNAAAGSVSVNTDRAPSQAYVVNEEGQILVHRLGKISVEGLTRKELQEKLQKELLQYLKDPIVTVQYLNHKVTVLGEVARPQVISMPEDQLTLMDVLVKSGDLTPTGRRDNIMIIRETGNERKVKYVSLEDHSILTSPWYYVQPNDIVYVAPDDEKRYKEEKRARFQTNFSIAASSISLLVIILDRILR